MKIIVLLSESLHMPADFNGRQLGEATVECTETAIGLQDRYGSPRKERVRGGTLSGGPLVDA